MEPRISVVIPLYNKEREIGQTLSSVLGQHTPPLEVIVIDDGSTDAGAEVVRRFGSPLVRLLGQANRGVSAARNRGIREAKGEYVALLDGDDRWHADYLTEIHRLIAAYPDCGAYGTSFYIRSGAGMVQADTPGREGVVDFFREALSHYVLIPSATTLRRDLVIETGGFPEGMKLGEDQYLWTKIARRAAVCLSPRPLVCYSRTAQNRSATLYTPENSLYSFEELFEADASDLSNEYIARVALGKALVASAKGGTTEARQAARFFRYTHRSRRILWKLRLLNSLPARLRWPLLQGYNALAWKIARKGL